MRTIIKYAMFVVPAILLTFCGRDSAVPVLKVTGSVNSETALSFDDLSRMDQIFMKDIAVIEERPGPGSPEKLRSVSSFKGVLLRDILWKAGMKYERKWEPGVYVMVKSASGAEAAFSFGEIFYSAAGRSIIIALEKDGDTIKPEKGVGELMVTTDVRAGRNLTGITGIEVSRVDVELRAYEDAKKKIIRKPSVFFVLADRKNGTKKQYGPDGIRKLPVHTMDDTVLIGECSGFRGIHSFEGCLLKDLLIDAGYGSVSPDYRRFVLVSSEDGLCATFSFGEIFNSRMSRNMVIALKKSGRELGPGDAFAMTAVNEDSKGGRSVRRISSITVY